MKREYRNPQLSKNTSVDYSKPRDRKSFNFFFMNSFCEALIFQMKKKMLSDEATPKNTDDPCQGFQKQLDTEAREHFSSIERRGSKKLLFLLRHFRIIRFVSFRLRTVVSRPPSIYIHFSLSYIFPSSALISRSKNPVFNWYGPQSSICLPEKVPRCPFTDQLTPVVLPSLRQSLHPFLPMKFLDQTMESPLFCLSKVLLPIFYRYHQSL